MSVYDKYEVVIGLEVHCQLLTDSKIFSSAPTTFGAAPNTQVCEVDLGLPGALPVLNKQAVEFAIRAGLALGCEIRPTSQFARKNYFYPDLPKGYQISQHVHPICEHGSLTVELESLSRRVRVMRIHMEEDAGKSSHLEGKPVSLVDLNRAGVPLIEIVSEPDLRSSDEAVAYLKELHSIVVYLGVCDGNMEEGSFRCDANVSVRLHGQAELGTRAELKNINSFKFIKDAINYEVRRQIDLIEAGQKIVQETRLYNPNKGVTFSMRSKEESHDYRYFPEPDLPLLVIDSAWLERVRAAMPELPAKKRARFVEAYDLGAHDAEVLCASAPVADYFEAAIEGYAKNPKVLANWVINELLREVSGDQTIDTVPVRPPQLARLVELIDTGVLSGKLAKQVFEAMVESGQEADAIVEEKGLVQVSDEGAITQIIDEIFEQNPGQVSAFREGKTTLIGWFVGQVMKQSRGKANPQIVNDLLRAKLEGQ
ncbi:MAG: Asp-tRNA(Asn)/Glu-tRNA(Gln) amidotransferase subunit GatB [Bradymonadaceae bacterium]|nr:Asp-tRNA(Asn)/Glu-tRNA(Gln) amidotransferase subunit GatB [Lujinxingiaceae bacterium]